MNLEPKKRRSIIELKILLDDNKLYCSRHQCNIKPWRFWQRRCYMGREDDSCVYLEVSNNDK